MKTRKLLRGDLIWLKKNPFAVDTDILLNVQSENRPYLIVSNNENNSKSPTINIVAVTKQTKKDKYPMHFKLDKDKYNLKFDSVVLAEQIRTVNKDKVDEVITSLDAEDLKKLDKVIYIQYIDHLKARNATC